jgi:hypothetical protein
MRRRRPVPLDRTVVARYTGAEERPRRCLLERPGNAQGHRRGLSRARPYDPRCAVRRQRQRQTDIAAWLARRPRDLQPRRLNGPRPSGYRPAAIASTRTPLPRAGSWVSLVRRRIGATPAPSTKTEGAAHAMGQRTLRPVVADEPRLGITAGLRRVGRDRPHRRRLVRQYPLTPPHVPARTRPRPGPWPYRTVNDNMLARSPRANVRG